MNDTFTVDSTVFKCDNAIFLLFQEAIVVIAKSLRLQYVQESSVQDNLCYVNIRGLCNEFRQTFTAADLQNYILAILHSGGYSEPATTTAVQIPYPSDAETFWNFVKSAAAL